MTIAEIITQLEEAKGPNRWIDARLDALFRFGSARMRPPGYEWAWQNFPKWSAHKQARGMCGVQHDNGDLGLIWDSPEFTGSVDAALALARKVFPDCTISADSWPEKAHVAICAGPTPSSIVEGEGHSSTQAVATVIAILKAKQAQEVTA